MMWKEENMKAVTVVHCSFSFLDAICIVGFQICVPKYPRLLERHEISS